MVPKIGLTGATPWEARRTLVPRGSLPGRGQPSQKAAAL